MIGVGTAVTTSALIQTPELLQFQAGEAAGQYWQHARFHDSVQPVFFIRDKEDIATLGYRPNIYLCWNLDTSQSWNSASGIRASK